MAEESEFKERYDLIDAILDKIKPFPAVCDDKTREAIDTERQVLVARAGWNSISIDELREIAAE